MSHGRLCDPDRLGRKRFRGADRAMRMLLAVKTERASTAKGSAEVLLNGKLAERLALNAENNGLSHQFIFMGSDARQTNRVEIRFAGQGSLAYQVAGRYFVPWDGKPANEALSIDVTCDRTRLEQDQMATRPPRYGAGWDRRRIW